MSGSIFEISGRKISPDYEPYIIAELSANHNGSLETALKMIDEAKKAGADAVKLQTYTPDTITLDFDSDDFRMESGLWKGKTLYSLYKEAHLPWDWHKQLFERAKAADITIFSSPFDNTAVDLLEDLGAPAYKIASFEAIDLPLISYVASTGKPMIISTGMANEQEIQDAIDVARTSGCKKVAILHCVSGYPAPAEDYNLATIPDMIERYGVAVGLSDHTLDNTTAIGSVALGACLIEKHFTLNRNGGGPDDSFSLEPEGLKSLCLGAKTVWRALGTVDYGTKSSEKQSLKFRRSLYFVRDIAAGQTITREHVKSIRPGFGLPPKMLEKIIGSRVKRAILTGTPVSLDQIENDTQA